MHGYKNHLGPACTVMLADPTTYNVDKLKAKNLPRVVSLARGHPRRSGDIALGSLAKFKLISQSIVNSCVAPSNNIVVKTANRQAQLIIQTIATGQQTILLQIFYSSQATIFLRKRLSKQKQSDFQVQLTNGNLIKSLDWYNDHWITK